MSLKALCDLLQIVYRATQKKKNFELETKERGKHGCWRTNCKWWKKEENTSIKTQRNTDKSIGTSRGWPTIDEWKVWENRCAGKKKRYFAVHKEIKEVVGNLIRVLYLTIFTEHLTDEFDNSFRIPCHSLL